MRGNGVADAAFQSCCRYLEWSCDVLSPQIGANKIGRVQCGTARRNMETDKVQESNGQEVPVQSPEDVIETDAWQFSSSGRNMETDKVQESNGQEVPVQSPEDVSETDAWQINFSGRREKNAVPSATDASSVPAKGSGCERNAEEYNMCHPRRGVALIFNHEYFKAMPSRSGSSKDREDLSKQLVTLGFEVKKHNNLPYTELSNVLMQTAATDHSSADCLLVVVMSHGEPGFLFTRDRPYPVQELWSYFTGDKCHSLVGKPKLFFIQACRGEKVDPGVSVDETDGYSMSYTIPIEADILVAYSTTEGYYSWRNPNQGSWFIQALCDELRLNGRTRDLMTMLTFVCRRVAIDYRSNVPNNEEMDLKKQIPCITSMLTRLVYFRQNKKKVISVTRSVDLVHFCDLGTERDTSREQQ